MREPDTLDCEPGGTLCGRLRVPGDKSISHRAVMLGAIAEGETEITGFLEGEDTLATLRAFRAMGVAVERSSPACLRIFGAGLRGLRAPVSSIDCGNSGTSMRLLAGLLAAQTFDSTLTGDASLSSRPMRRVVEPLERMGARIECSPLGTAPIRIYGGRELRGIDYRLPVASAQLKSSLLLAGLYASGPTRVEEPLTSRDHTERMLLRFGASLQRTPRGVRLDPGAVLHGTRVEVPSDLSSAAFFLVGAAIASGSDLVLEGVGINPTRSGVLEVLRRMGAGIEVDREAADPEADGEPVATLRVRGGAGLRGTRIPPELVPLTIDEIPILCVAAACAEGETVLAGAEELRHKESDRIAVMARGLRALGIAAEPTSDGMVIRGGPLAGGEIDSAGDHRVAMSFAIAALRARGPIRIRACRNIATSFPGFAEAARRVGLRIRASGDR